MDVRVSVLMAARNEERHIREQLEALSAQVLDRPWELLVLDNGSTDSTPAVVQEFIAAGAPFRIVDASAKAGQAYCLNIGVALTDADLLVFCDADDVVGEGWLAAMVGGLDVHPVVTGPNELDRLNPAWLAESRGRSGSEALGSFYGLFPLIRGNNFGVRRAVWTQVRGMDESLKALQDQDLSMRCWLEGIPLAGLDGAVVHYRYRDSPRALWRQGFSYGVNRPRLARRAFEARGVRPHRLAGWRSWVRLLVGLPALVTHPGRSNWMWIAGNRWGHLVGSVRHRFLLL